MKQKVYSILTFTKISPASNTGKGTSFKVNSPGAVTI